MTTMRPQETEYAPFYAHYVTLADTDDVLSRLKLQGDELVQFYYQLPKEKIDFAYAPGKWTPKQLLGHLNDAERVFSYRAMRIARGEQINLPGFDQDDYVDSGRFEQRSLGNLVDEFKYLRLSNLHLYQSFTEDDLVQTGTASGEVTSVRALLHISAGHVQHHLNIIRERYL